MTSRSLQTNTRITPSLHTIASELVLEILREASLATLVSIAQTSARLYNMLRTIRSIWMNSPDIHDLPISAGETLTTIPTSSFLRLALRAVIIRTHLETPFATPVQILKIFELGVEMSVLLPGGNWVIVTHGEKMWIHNIEHGSPEIDSEPIFLASGKIEHVKFESVGSGKATLVLMIAESTNLGLSQSQALIFDLHFAPEGSSEDRPHIASVVSYHIPNLFTIVSIRGHFIMTDDPSDSGDRLVIIDYQRGSGTNFDIRLANFADEIETEELGMTIYDISFIDTLQKLVILAYLRTADREVILFADVPAIESVGTPKSGEISWSQSTLHPTHQYLVPDFQSTKLLISHDEALLSRHIPLHEYTAPSTGVYSKIFHGRDIISVRLAPKGADGEMLFFRFRYEQHPDDLYYTSFKRDHSPEFELTPSVHSRQGISCFNASCTRLSSLRISIPEELLLGRHYMIQTVNPNEGRIVLLIYDDEQENMGRLYIMQY
ncbi:hypothetical protein SISNIDRAFT_461584 [Sistotremastrum niveocremeum HHB9708]|uniref:F-box domain-containing protein n=1 Tax=Sistotremastrum niveocremeum HHB9708 TaxID=1314777 RepID=A0A164MH64_9AGAM|nr:hypothetical protein SISNIDRAFT_461584 [Sistotremastrum niveocremeum HHB9708]